MSISINLAEAQAQANAPDKVIFRVLEADISETDPKRTIEGESYNPTPVFWFDSEFLDVVYEYMEGRPYHTAANSLAKNAQYDPTSGSWRGAIALKMAHLRNAFQKCGITINDPVSAQALRGMVFEGDLYREYRDRRGFLIGTHMVVPTKLLGSEKYVYLGDKRFVARAQEQGGKGISPQDAIAQQLATPTNIEAVLDAVADALDGKKSSIGVFTGVVAAVPGARQISDVITAAGSGRLTEYLNGRVSVDGEGTIHRTKEGANA